MWWISPVTGVKSYIGKCSADSFTAKKFAKVDGDDTDRVLVIKVIIKWTFPRIYRAESPFYFYFSLSYPQISFSQNSLSLAYFNISSSFSLSR